MKRLVYLATVALVAMLILVPSAFAQGTAVIEQTVEMEQTILQPTGGPSIGGGGPAVVLPAAAALLLGSGVLAYAVLRRR